MEVASMRKVPFLLALIALNGLFVPLSGDIIVGATRRVTVTVPPGYDPVTPMPLFIFLHGYGGGSDDGVAGQFRSYAASKKYLYAAPNGTFDSCGSRFWNATNACCKPICSGADVDDSSYIIGIIQEIQSKLNVDPLRIFIAGYSNGGFIGFLIACDPPAGNACL